MIKTDIKIKEYVNRKLASLKVRADSAGKELEAYAKENKPWKNQTGNAVNSIQGGSEQIGSLIRIYVSGNMDYFPFLELGHRTKSGRFIKLSTLRPALDALSDGIIESMKEIFKT